MDIDKENLIKYVKDQETSLEINNSILKLINESEPVTMTVYRGHGRTPTLKDSIYYSATTSKTVATEEFSGKSSISDRGSGCCVFTIHLDRVPAVLVNETLRDLLDDIGSYKEESEVLFLGGGTFYKDKDFDEPGIKDNGDGEYETWYNMTPKTEEPAVSMPSDERNNVERALEIIDPDEYDLIETTKDIREMELPVELTDEEVEELLKQIEEKKKMEGGKRKPKRKTRNKRKRNKRKTKKVRKSKQKKTKKRKVKRKHKKRKGKTRKSRK